jgi:hypothetical protein
MSDATGADVPVDDLRRAVGQLARALWLMADEVDGGDPTRIAAMYKLRVARTMLLDLREQFPA